VGSGLNPATGIAIKTDKNVIHDFHDEVLGPRHSVETYVEHPVVGTTVVDEVYVDNTHPATVASTGGAGYACGQYASAQFSLYKILQLLLHSIIN
jgi:hypothetical protein